MTLIGCWRVTGTPTQNGVVTVDHNETTPLRPDSLLGEFTKASESRISETRLFREDYAAILRSMHFPVLSIFVRPTRASV